MRVDRIAVNALAGKRLQELRISSGKTRKNIAELIGITHQQLSKYESGLNGISIAALIKIADLFKVSPSYFYNTISTEDDIFDNSSRLTLNLNLCKYFDSIKNIEVKESLFTLVKNMAKEGRK